MHEQRTAGLASMGSLWQKRTWGLTLGMCLLAASASAQGFPTGKLPKPELPKGKLAEVAAGALPNGLGQEQVVAGLREMLRTGSQNAVKEVGRQDGFLENAEIHLPLPQTLDKAAQGLRKLSLGALAEDLEISMNRAAEAAAVEATPVLEQAIEKLDFQDAAGILAGGEDAATQFFRKQSSEELAKAFRPVVEKNLEKVGTAKLYDSFASKVATIPFMGSPQFDLDEYVTQQTLEGLLIVMAQEEARMRKDSSARTSPALQAIFGN